MCKPGGTVGETRERALQKRKVVGSLGRIMKGRSVSMEVKRDLRNTVIVPIVTYASETWAWNESQRSTVQAVEMSYLRSDCGVSRMDGMSNESVYEHFRMCHVGEGKMCGVVEKVKRQTVKWFGHVEQIEEGKMTKRVYVSEREGGNIVTPRMSSRSSKALGSWGSLWPDCMVLGSCSDGPGFESRPAPDQFMMCYWHEWREVARS